MTEAARHQLATLITMGAECCVATYDLTDDDLRDVLARADVIVDAVLGYRIKDAPRGEAERLIGFVVQAARPVVSLDLPSGLDPDTGESLGPIVTAQATMTLALPKAGLLRAEGLTHVGRIYLADLGLPEALYTALGIAVGHPFAGSRIVLLDRSS
jgi:NAD(P)H-hydrate epimerase